MSRTSNIHRVESPYRSYDLQTKYRGKLVAFAFAAIILTAGTPSVTPAFADSCRYLEEPELERCLLRKAYKQHELNQEIDEEGARGGCGPKCKKLQDRADDNAANMRRITPNSRKTDYSSKTRRWGGPAD